VNNNEEQNEGPAAAGGDNDGGFGNVPGTGGPIEQLQAQLDDPNTSKRDAIRIEKKLERLQ